ncbi:hypothetical protein ACOSP7_010414 [Xanthoceras sorbifolium]
MHDLVYDLAESIAGNEFIILEYSLCDSKLHSIPKYLYEAKKLRTLNLLFPKGNLGEAHPDLFSSFRDLHALNLGGNDIKRLHNLVSCLISLRYLNISNTFIETLPKSISDLNYLQELNLAYCYDLIKLPMKLVELVYLRHLMIHGCDKLSHLPNCIGKLVQFQTLSTFIVGTGTYQGLKQLQFLRFVGELNIRQLGNAIESRLANLRMKPKLRSLGLSWRNDHDDLIMSNNNHSRLAEELLKHLQSHRNLKTLSINGYTGKYFPRWIGIPELPNLTNILLIYCKRCEHLPTLGQLPFLKVIYMSGMSNVKNIGIEFYGRVSGRQSQSLQELSFIDFPNLKFWNIPWFPSLHHLELQSCNEKILRSAELQHVTTLQNLEIHSCPSIKNLPTWIGNLSSLISLAISNCYNIISLPEDLQHLINHQHLSIRECPGLENHYKKYISEDWPKVADIPHIYIGSTEPRQYEGASSYSCSK